MHGVFNLNHPCRVVFVCSSTFHQYKVSWFLSAAATNQSLDTRRAPHKYAVTKANW